MARSTVVFTVKGKRIKETEKAILFHVDEVVGITDEENFKPKDDWFPFSQVHKLHWTPEHSDDYLILSEWILTQKNYPTPENIRNAEIAAQKSSQGTTEKVTLPPRASKSITQDPATKYGFDDMDDDIPF